MNRNCWDVMGCEHYPGSRKVDERGLCPASTLIIATGIHNGLFGGRVCWAIDETWCGNKSFGFRNKKTTTCMQCKFYLLVMEEEIGSFMSSEDIRNELNEYQIF